MEPAAALAGVESLVDEAVAEATTHSGPQESWPAVATKAEVSERFVGALVELKDGSFHACTGTRGDGAGLRLDMTADVVKAKWHKDYAFCQSANGVMRFVSGFFTDMATAEARVEMLYGGRRAVVTLAGADPEAALTTVHVRVGDSAPFPLAAGYQQI